MAAEDSKLRLSTSELEAATKSKPHLEKYVTKLKELDKNNNGELSLEQGNTILTFFRVDASTIVVIDSNRLRESPIALTSSSPDRGYYYHSYVSAHQLSYAVAQCVGDLVESESSSRMYKKFLLTAVVLLICSIAIILGVTYAIVHQSQPMKTENGILISTSGFPVAMSTPRIVATATPPASETQTNKSSIYGTVSGKRRRALLAEECHDDYWGSVSSAGLTSICQQVQLGSGMVLLSAPDPGCNTTNCGFVTIHLAVQYDQCLVLTGPLPNCTDVFTSFTILSGVDVLNPSHAYHVDLQFDCAVGWEASATISSVACSTSSSGTATSPPPPKSLLQSLPPPPPLESLPPPPLESLPVPPPPQTVSKCENGTYWDFTTLSCTANPTIPHCTKVQYRDAYTPDCRACEGLFLINNGVCECDDRVTYLTSDGHCLCRNDPLVVDGGRRPGIEACSKTLERNVQARCKNGYAGITCEYQNVIDNF